MVYFTSDFHFGHENILMHDKRPFSSIDEHDEKLIDIWNSTVTDRDDVWFLGDICFRNEKPASWYIGKLKGRIHMVWGNHDDAIRHQHSLFFSCQDLAYIKLKGYKLFLFHYSCRSWRSRGRGSLHLFGHSHGSLDHAPLGKSMDVGIHNNGYKLLSLDDVLRYMETKPILEDYEHGHHELTTTGQ